MKELGSTALTEDSDSKDFKRVWKRLNSFPAKPRAELLAMRERRLARERKGQSPPKSSTPPTPSPRKKKRHTLARGIDTSDEEDAILLSIPSPNKKSPMKSPRRSPRKSKATKEKEKKELEEEKERRLQKRGKRGEKEKKKAAEEKEMRSNKGKPPGDKRKRSPGENSSDTEANSGLDDTESHSRFVLTFLLFFSSRSFCWVHLQS